MNNLLCDNCTSSNIEIIKDKDSEMDCYCNDCNTENYTVSKWWINESNFTDDEEKMIDFNTITKDQFLNSYSYITEQEYDNTMRQLEEVTQ